MRAWKICGLVLVLLLALPAVVAAQQLPPGVSVTCDNGAEFNNGVEVIVNQMRSGFTYRATAIGIDDFDPVLVVLDESGGGLCSDDDRDAAGYSFDLPTTGRVRSSGSSAQVRFNQNSSSAFADVSLVVGGLNDQVGEFVLIMEGMYVTTDDNAGDPFSIRITPGMTASEVPLSVYMISKESDLDPLMYRADEDLDVLEDANDDQIYCDDAGDSSRCYGESYNLADSYVSTSNGDLAGFDYDAMLSFPIEGLELNDDPDFNFFNLVFTSFNRETYGQYVLVFHVGMDEVRGGGNNNGGGNNGGGKGGNPIGGGDAGDLIPDFAYLSPDKGAAKPVTASPVAQVPTGISVECDNGTSFTNGVEIRVVEMRSGFSYTATAIGIDGFDPVLAVMDESGGGLCNDDEEDTANFDADLPTTGPVAPSDVSSQITFSQNSSEEFADISLVVGGFGDSVGEFILILDGMGVTDADGAGDPFAVRVTPGMTASEVPLTVYMLARTNTLDPFMYLSIDGDIAMDSDDQPIVCDDSGNADRCYGDSYSLEYSFVDTVEGSVGNNTYNAMLRFPLFGLELSDDAEDNFLTFVMTSFEQSTSGKYVLVFHVGTDDVR